MQYRAEAWSDRNGWDLMQASPWRESEQEARSDMLKMTSGPGPCAYSKIIAKKEA